MPPVHPQQMIKAYRAERCVAVAYCTGSRVVQYSPTMENFPSIVYWNRFLEDSFHFTHQGEKIRLFHGRICLAEGSLRLSRNNENTICICQVFPTDAEFSGLEAWMTAYTLSFRKPAQETEVAELTGLLHTLEI